MGLPKALAWVALMANKDSINSKIYFTQTGGRIRGGASSTGAALREGHWSSFLSSSSGEGSPLVLLINCISSFTSLLRYPLETYLSVEGATPPQQESGTLRGPGES